MGETGLVSVPAHGMGVGTWWSLRSLPIQVNLWFYELKTVIWISLPHFISPLFAQYIYGLFPKLQQEGQSTFNPRTAYKYPRFSKTVGNGVMRTPSFLVRDFWLKDVDVLVCVVPGVEITHGSSGAGAEPSP